MYKSTNLNIDLYGELIECKKEKKRRMKTSATSGLETSII